MEWIKVLGYIAFIFGIWFVPFGDIFSYFHVSCGFVIGSFILYKYFQSKVISSNSEERSESSL